MNRKTVWPKATLALCLAACAVVGCESLPTRATDIDASILAPSIETLRPYTDAGIRAADITEEHRQALLLQLEVLTEGVLEAAARTSPSAVGPVR